MRNFKTHASGCHFVDNIKIKMRIVQTQSLRTDLLRRAMQILLLLMSFFFLIRDAEAQTLHAVLVSDGSPAAQWGKFSAAISMDVKVIDAMIGSSMPKSQLDVHLMEIEQDEKSDPNIVLKAIADLRVKPNDTLLFYYSGHGAADDDGQYFEMARGKLHRKTVRDSLESKRARLVVILTDCCNVRSDGFFFSTPFINTIPPDKPSPLFQSLFLDQKGTIDITSSAPGESAFFTPIREGSIQIPGSIFTQELAELADVQSATRMTWDDLVRGVSLKVHAAFHEYYPNGTSIAKGKSVQKQQTVHPIEYPGMPANQGPRTGFVVRDFPGRGSVITEVTPSSPASQIFVIAKDRFDTLRQQQVVVAINGNRVDNTEAVVKAVADSAQIMRLTIRDATQGSFDVLMRLRY